MPSALLLGDLGLGLQHGSLGLSKATVASQPKQHRLGTRKDRLGCFDVDLAEIGVETSSSG